VLLLVGGGPTLGGLELLEELDGDDVVVSFGFGAALP